MAGPPPPAIGGLALPRPPAAWALLAAAAALPFHELVLRVGPLGLRPFETLLGLAGLLALPGAVRDWRGWLGRRAVDREVGATVLLGTLTLILFRGPGDSLRELRLVIIEPALFYVLLSRVLPAEHRRLWLAVALVLGGVAASLLGVVQLAMGNGIAAEGVERMRGAYRSPNNLALYLDRAIPIAAAMLLAGPLSLWKRVWVRAPFERRPEPGTPLLVDEAPHPRRPHPGPLPEGESGTVPAGERESGSRLVEVLWLVALVVMLAAQAFTFSLGGWMATGLGLVVVVLLARRPWVLLGLGAVGLVGLAGLAVWRPERIVSHLTGASDSTSTLRLYLWGSALQMLRDHPLFGVGLDSFLYLYNPGRGGSYLDPAAWREPDLSHPHNLFLDWWLSLGVAGFLLLLRLLGRFYRLARAGLRNPTDRAFTVGAAGAMVAALLHGMTDNSFFLPDLAALWWATFVLALAPERPAV